MSGLLQVAPRAVASTVFSRLAPHRCSNCDARTPVTKLVQLAADDDFLCTDCASEILEAAGIGADL